VAYADVSVATMFNCFPTEEDLVYGRLDDFEQEMLDAIRDRPPDEYVSYCAPVARWPHSAKLTPSSSPRLPRLEAWVIANALIGDDRALIDTTRRGILAGTSRPRIATRVQTQGQRARLRDRPRDLP
jgi:AcrR family transcriptional regulator